MFGWNHWLVSAFWQKELSFYVHNTTFPATFTRSFHFRSAEIKVQGLHKMK